MSLKRPCIECGEPSSETRCVEHQLLEQARLSAPRTRATDVSPGRWKRLSRKLRRLQPFCSACGSTRLLQVDHVVPIGARPEWAFELANLDVLCRECNRAKSDTMPSEEIVAAIERKITRGGKPGAPPRLSRGKPQFPLHTDGMPKAVVNEAGEVR